MAGDDVVDVAPFEGPVTAMELAVPVSVPDGSSLVLGDVSDW